MSQPGPGQVLFAVVRRWARTPSAGEVDLDTRGRIVLVCEAVCALSARGLPATVNTVAREVGIDQSGVSRLIKDAVTAGYLAIAVAPGDARRREASLTTEGRALLDQAHRWQEAVFDRLTDGWSDERRQILRDDLVDLIDRAYELDL